MKVVDKLKTVFAAGALALVGTAASATVCTVSGVNITSIDSVAITATDATACEDFVGNIGAGSVLIDGLNDGTFFSGEFAAGTTWTFVGKDETAADSGADVEADIGSVTGDWLANFTPDIVNNVIVALKGGPDGGALFLFKELATAGSLFEGTFDMVAAGLGAHDLSNLSVAGVFVDSGDPGGGVIPLPAGLPLLLSALGIVGFAGRRSRKSA